MNKKFDSKKISRKEIVNYLNQSSEIAEYQLTLIDEIVKVTEVCIETLNNGGKIIFCGNGGSASDSQHLAAELVGRFMKNRKPIPAISINTDTSVLTSISNDFGYNYVFSKQIEALGNEKDTLFQFTNFLLSNIYGAGWGNDDDYKHLNSFSNACLIKLKQCKMKFKMMNATFHAQYVQKEISTLKRKRFFEKHGNILALIILMIICAIGLQLTVTF